MKRIVVGSDGSLGATAAVVWAAHLAEALDAEVVLASSFELDEFDLDGRALTFPEGPAAELVQQWSAPLERIGVAHDTVLMAGPAAHTLAQCADEREADLLVVGARGVGGLTGRLVGSVADHLAHHTDRPLAVVPRGASTGVPSRALLGADASAGSLAAARWLAPVAAQLGMPVTAAHVSMLDPRTVPEDDPRSPAAMLRGPWTAPLTDRGVEPEALQLTSEHVARALLDATHDVGADLLVIGTRLGHAPLHPRIGGVTMQLVHGASEAVTVVVPPT